MDNKQKLLNGIGLAIRANKYVYGQRLIENVQANKNLVSLVIVTSDMGKSQKKKVLDKCSYYNVPVIDNLLTVEQLNDLTNIKHQISAIGITDVNLKKLIMSYI